MNQAQRSKKIKKKKAVIHESQCGHDKKIKAAVHWISLSKTTSCTTRLYSTDWTKKQISSSVPSSVGSVIRKIETRNESVVELDIGTRPPKAPELPVSLPGAVQRGRSDAKPGTV